jgi:hypothetical protein
VQTLISGLYYAGEHLLCSFLVYESAVEGNRTSSTKGALLNVLIVLESRSNL